MRLEGAKHTPLAALSRAAAGIRFLSLLINLPGSPKGCRESLEAVLDLIPHALQMVRGMDHEEIIEHAHDIP